MILSDHAREAMEQDGITEDEVRSCLEHGRLGIRENIKGEVRYGKRLELKGRRIQVIYTLRAGEERIITAYIQQKRKPWHERN